MIQDIPNESDFNLSKVKLVDGGLKVKYQIVSDVNGVTTVLDREETSTRIVHSDMYALLAHLREIVTKVFYLDPVDMIDKLDVCGLACSGTGDKFGITLTSTIVTPSGQVATVKTPRIKLSENLYGFEKELDDLYKKVKAEVYNYLFMGKQSEVSTFAPSAVKEEAQDPFDEDRPIDFE